jgi:hypothetical protein
MKLIFVLAVVMASFARAETLGVLLHPQNIPKEWKSWAQDTDCGIGLMGCYMWIPINKKYLDNAGPFGGHFVKNSFVACKKSLDPGPVPKAACRNHECVISRTN